MGAGKSTLGALLAQQLGWTFLDLDEEIVRAEQKSIADIFASAGEAAFRDLEHAALSLALQREGVVLALGGGAIETAANRRLLHQDGFTLLLYLEAPLEVLLARCEQQQLDKKAARRPVLEQRAELAQRFHRRKPWYESAHWTLHTSGRTPQEIAAAIVQQWNQTPWR
jgi:shikimate kinase